MRSTKLLLCALALSVACQNPTASMDADVVDAGSVDAFIPPDGVRCLDLERLERCEGGACESEACRGDEVCQEAACVPWTDAELFADFDLDYVEGRDREIVVQVHPGGFPRSQTQAVRFTFGDGVAGQGEGLIHQYAEPGIYPVELEVRLTGLRFLRASRLAVIEGSSGHQPLSLTVDAIPAELNGSRPFMRDSGTPDDPSDDVAEDFHLQVPRSGFVVDVAILDDPADPIDRATISLTADQAFGATAAGAELAGQLAFDETPTRRVACGQWTVPSEMAAPVGFVTFTLSATSEGGASHESTLRVEAVDLPPERDPFDREMFWLFRTDGDFFTTRVSNPGASRFTMISEATPNGEPDFIEELTLLGALGDDAELNALYLDWILDAIAVETLRYYGVAPDGTPLDGIPLTIVWQGADGAPDPATFTADGAFSMMRFGGFFDGSVGISDFGPYNEDRVDDSRVNRGIATAALISALTDAPVVSQTLDPVKPGVGAPLGTHPHDATVLSPSFDRYATDNDPDVQARFEDLNTVAHNLALAIASVTAHEMGHAMGLMPNGPPPAGFFGGEGDVTMVGAALTNSHHADLPGVNLMQAGGNYLDVIETALARVELPLGADLVQLAESIALENRLSPYSRAYLQRRLTYAEF